MASWFTRVLDRITPWDRGGEVQRRKKREEEQAQVQAQRQAAPTSQASRRTPTIQQPQNVFSQDIEDTISPKINIGLTETISPTEQQNRFAQAKEIENRIPKPQQSNWNKLRDVFDANTEADQYRRAIDIANKKATQNRRAGMDQERAIGRAVDNARVLSKAPARSGADDVKDFATSFTRGAATVPSALGRVVTGVGEDATDLTGFLLGTAPNAVYRRLRTGSWEGASDNAIANQMKSLRKPLESASEFLDRSATTIGGEQNMPAYRYTQVAGNIIPVVASGGALAATKGSRLASAGKLSEATKWDRAANAISGASSESKLGKIAEFLDKIQSPLRSARELVFKSPNASKGSEVIQDVLSDADIEDIVRNTNIPVRENPTDLVSDVLTPVDNSVNVRNVTNDRPLIRELGGDAQTVNVAQAARQAEIDRARRLAFEESKNVRPDQSIEGVSPRQPEQPFRLDESSVAQSQDEIIDEYADFLRSIGEGNGVVVNQATGTRVSNNVRFGDTKGKRMTKADWRAEAERQFREGKADPEAQKLFNDAKDPEVQSLLSRGERPDAPQGTPIRVQETKGIPVRDETIVPQNLPETPGTVRATTATAPAKTEAQLVAETQPPTPRTKDLPKSEFDEGGTLPTTQADTPSAIPEPNSGLRGAYERLLSSVQDNQAAYKAQKKLNKAEKKARKLEQQRIYDELVAQGRSRAEAERISRAAWSGKYTKNSVANFDVSGKEAEEFRKAIDDTFPHGWERENTKTAFNHLIDPNRTDPLPDGERRRIRQFLQKTLGEEKAAELEDVLLSARQSEDRSLLGRAADFMTSSIAAGDISAVGRQGLSGLINHPGMSKAAWSDAMKALMSADGEKAFVKELQNNRYATFISEMMDGKWQTLADIADEARGVDTANRLTSWYVNPSNRHYNTYLDSLRLRQKTAIIDRYGGPEGFLKAAENANPEDPKKWMKAWNNVIDRQSGRGSFSAKGSPTVGDMQVLFSARNLASKFQRLTAPAQLGLLKTNPEAYLYQLKETGAQAAVIGSTLAALHASGIADIENGKIKIGNTRVDITGGFSTIFNTMNKIRKSWGIFHDTSQNSIFDPSAGDAAIDYLKNQFAPTLGSVLRLADVDWSKGEDKYGNKIDTSWWLQTAPMPAVAKTAVDSISEGENILGTARNMGLDALGFNTNTYQSAEDKDNAARAETADTVNASLQGIRDTGLLSDKMIQSIDDEDVRDILTGKSDKQLSEDELGKVRKKLVEGITSGTGADSDSAYRERGEYDKDIAALQLKREMVEAEPNHKPSDLEALDIQIKRSEILRDNDIPFELLEKYQKTGVEDWRDLEETNPELFQRLWAIDEMMTNEGVGYKSGSFTEQKYYQKSRKSGSRGGSRGGGSGRKRSWSADFGKITGSGSNAPKVKEYQTMDQAVGKIPTIKRIRPNIVHTIREGRL